MEKMEGICKYNTCKGFVEEPPDTVVKIGIILSFHLESFKLNV